MKKLIVLLSTALLLTACSKVTIENYEQLKLGMSYEEVTGVIGKSSDCTEKVGTRFCTWGNDNKNITVTFIAGKATLYSHKGL